MTIYTSLAKWKFLGELDFTDMYWQLHLRLQTNQDKRQLQYLCIRTASGTLAYARAPIGLLGMDAVQEELTDKLLGDLVLRGAVAKVADNVYFGGSTLAELHEVFEEIVRLFPEEYRVELPVLLEFLEFPLLLEALSKAFQRLLCS